MNKGVTPANFSWAREFFARALEIDPVNVEALVGRATVDAYSGGAFGPVDRLTRFASAEADLMKAFCSPPAMRPRTRRWACCATSPTARTAALRNSSAPLRLTGTWRRRIMASGMQNTVSDAPRKLSHTFARRCGSRRTTRSPMVGWAPSAWPISTWAKTRKPLCG